MQLNVIMVVVGFFMAMILYEAEFMDLSEIVVFLASIIGSIKFLTGWYKSIAGAWPEERCKWSRRISAILPPAALFIMLVILLTIADPTVSESAFWTFFYVVLGFLWVCLGLLASYYCFDVSWHDDVINQNKDEPALYPIIGSFIGLSLIYSGANIGEGPGWWCVLFAGGLGIGAWLLLGNIIQRVTGVFDTVTIGRDAPAGIRMGFYLAASGLILGKASSGDWTSFTATVFEFLIGWYILPLTFVAIYVEKLYARKRAELAASGRRGVQTGGDNAAAVGWGAAYIVIAAVTVLGVNLWK